MPLHPNNQPTKNTKSWTEKIERKKERKKEERKKEASIGKISYLYDHTSENWRSLSTVDC